MTQGFGRLGNWAQRVITARPALPQRFDPSDSNTSVEQKYVFAGMYADLIDAWVTTHCDPDPEFPLGTISSIYYDTPTLQLYRREAQQRLPENQSPPALVRRTLRFVDRRLARRGAVLSGSQNEDRIVAQEEPRRGVDATPASAR